MANYTAADVKRLRELTGAAAEATEAKQAEEAVTEAPAEEAATEAPADETAAETTDEKKED